MQPDKHLPTGFPAGFGQGLDEVMPAHIVEENILPPVSPAHNMMQRPGIFNPSFARHFFLINLITSPVNLKNARCTGLIPLGLEGISGQYIRPSSENGKVAFLIDFITVLYYKNANTQGAARIGAQ
jgi:hypothetical protein